MHSSTAFWTYYRQPRSFGEPGRNVRIADNPSGVALEEVAPTATASIQCQRSVTVCFLVVALRGHEKHHNEKSDQRHVVRSRHFCRHRWLCDLPDGRFHGRRERQLVRSVGNITCVPIALTDEHSGSALSTNCRLHHAFRPLLLHLCKLGSANFRSEHSAFPATSNRLKTDHRQLCAYVALCRVGCLRNSHIDVELAACSALAQIGLIAKASLNIKIAPLPLRPRWFWVDHRQSGSNPEMPVKSGFR
jgi:hypothetical protein